MLKKFDVIGREEHGLSSAKTASWATSLCQLIHRAQRQGSKVVDALSREHQSISKRLSVLFLNVRNIDFGKKQPFNSSSK